MNRLLGCSEGVLTAARTIFRRLYSQETQALGGWRSGKGVEQWPTSVDKGRPSLGDPARKPARPGRRAASESQACRGGDALWRSDVVDGGQGAKTGKEGQATHTVQSAKWRRHAKAIASRVSGDI